jgi:chromosomal replication initiation ATPase DnaA
MTTGLSLTEIGKIFGIGNYSTVSNSIERINRKKKEDKALQNSISEIKSSLK